MHLGVRIYVMLLHSNHRHVSATHVAIFRMVRTREYKYHYNCTCIYN